MIGQGTLEEELARARSTDPETSHEAAASVKALTAKQEAVLGFLRRFGPHTDEELVRAYGHAVAFGWNPALYPEQSESGLRTRRKELVAKGKVVDTGDRKRTESGRNAIVWKAAS